jgi:hypothetical protein
VGIAMLLDCLASVIAPSSCHQIEDKDDECNYQEKVNQAAGNMETEAQEPQNKNDYKNRPKHGFSLCALRAHES